MYRFVDFFNSHFNFAFIITMATIVIYFVLKLNITNLIYNIVLFIL